MAAQTLMGAAMGPGVTSVRNALRRKGVELALDSRCSTARSRSFST